MISALARTSPCAENDIFNNGVERSYLVHKYLRAGYPLFVRGQLLGNEFPAPQGQLLKAEQRPIIRTNYIVGLPARN